MDWHDALQVLRKVGFRVTPVDQNRWHLELLGPQIVQVGARVVSETTMVELAQSFVRAGYVDVATSPTPSPPPQ